MTARKAVYFTTRTTHAQPNEDTIINLPGHCRKKRSRLSHTLEPSDDALHERSTCFVYMQPSGPGRCRRAAVVPSDWTQGMRRICPQSINSAALNGKMLAAAKAARLREGSTPDCELDDDDHSDIALNMLIVKLRSSFPRSFLGRFFTLLMVTQLCRK